MTTETREHKLRYSDSSLYDSVCVYCGDTDPKGECPRAPVAHHPAAPAPAPAASPAGEATEKLRYALQSFVDYYTQAGIGPCNEGEDDEGGDGFDGDERFNVRLGREALESFAAVLTPAAAPLPEGSELPDAPGFWERDETIRVGSVALTYVYLDYGARLSYLRTIDGRFVSCGWVDTLPRYDWHPAQHPAGGAEREEEHRLLPPSTHAYGMRGGCKCVSCIEQKLASLTARLAAAEQERDRLRKFVTDSGTTCWACEKCGHATSGECLWCALAAAQERVGVLTGACEAARAFVGRAWTNSPMGSANEQGLHAALIEIDKGLKAAALAPPAAAAEVGRGEELEAKVRSMISANAVHRNGTVLGRENWKTVIDHLLKEVDELKRGILNRNQENILEELGDVLGIVVHAAVKAGFTMRQVEQREMKKLDERFTCTPPSTTPPGGTGERA